jgi:hypothetical protein
VSPHISGIFCIFSQSLAFLLNLTKLEMQQKNKKNIIGFSTIFALSNFHLYYCTFGRTPGATVP